MKNVLTRILKRTVECRHHWHQQFTTEWHCCGCPSTSDAQAEPQSDAQCVRSSDDESFAAWLPPDRPLAAPTLPARRRRRAAVAA